MDTSEQYIKMRLAAIPCLGMGEPPLEPYHFKAATPDFSKTIWIDAKGDWYHSTENEACQLPRQDQLQAMYGDYDECLEALYWWQESNRMGDYYGYNLGDFNSMDQLWIAFVMKERFGKVWNGETWHTQEGT